ncbi:hypothetical protein EPUL_005931, partial [Erysiphe pulchra]
MKRGAKSYRDLYTVNGKYYGCPSATCRALGLCFDDSEWISLFDEIKDTTPATSLRQTFASGLALAVINDPQSLWDRFRVSFTDDCLYRIRNLGDRLNPPPIEWDENRCRYDYGLWLLGENLRDHNLSWIEARIAGLLHDWIHREANPLLAEALNINFHAESYTTIVDTVESGSIPNTFFVQGPAGTGKKFLYTTLCSYFRAKGEVVLCVAPSGIASLLLPNGRTSHSTFRIPLDCDESSRCHIPKQSNLAKLLKRTSLIIWDEVTMQPRYHFDAVDRVLQDIRDNRNLFGGIPVVLGGDFAQILPVVKR